MKVLQQLLEIKLKDMRAAQKAREAADASRHQQARQNHARAYPATDLDGVVDVEDLLRIEDLPSTIRTIVDGALEKGFLHPDTPLNKVMAGINSYSHTLLDAAEANDSDFGDTVKRLFAVGHWFKDNVPR